MARTAGPLTGARARVIVDAVVHILEELATEPGESLHVSHFDSVVAPDEPLLLYGTRIFDHMRCSAECFALALIYINRYLEAAEERLSTTNVHRLFVTSVLLATKFFDDKHRSNKTCAALGGIRTKELNELESRFLQRIRWSVYVSQEECEECMEALLLTSRPHLAQAVSCGSPVRRRAVPAVEVRPASLPTTPPKQLMRGGARHKRSSSFVAALATKRKLAKAGTSACKAPKAMTARFVLNVRLKLAGRRPRLLFDGDIGAQQHRLMTRRVRMRQAAHTSRTLYGGQAVCMLCS